MSSDPSPGPSTSSGSSSDVKSRMAERMAKMRSLHMKRTESRTLNHREVVEEDRRNKEPKNMEARKKRADYVLKEVSWNHQSKKSYRGLSYKKRRFKRHKVWDV